MAEALGNCLLAFYFLTTARRYLYRRGLRGAFKARNSFYAGKFVAAAERHVLIFVDFRRSSSTLSGALSRSDRDYDFHGLMNIT
jgi:hypothetical protein